MAIVPFTFNNPFVDMKVLDHRSLTVSGFDLSLKQHWKEEARPLDLPETEEDVGLGGSVWEGGFVLADYLQHVFPQGGWKGKRVLELGSGTGVVGIVAMLLGADVVITDGFEGCLPLIEKNAKENAKSIFPSGDVTLPQVKKLWWNDEKDTEQVLALGPFDIVLAADCIYREDAYDDLLACLKTFCSPETSLLMSYKDRYASQLKFLKKFDQFFTRDEVHSDMLHPDFRSKRIHIFNCKVTEEGTRFIRG